MKRKFTIIILTLGILIAATKNINAEQDKKPTAVTAFENVHVQILQMADMLTEGIVKQFPNMLSGYTLAKSHTEQSSNNRIVLNQNSPKPFNDRTVISYFIPEDIKQAQLLVYDDMGILLRKLISMQKAQEV